jgi:hypothetical protein
MPPPLRAHHGRRTSENRRNPLEAFLRSAAQLLAEREASWSSKVVALREESYYTANMRRTFTAFSTRRFHIASPLFKPMIANRIEYALKRLEKQQADDQITPHEEHQRQSMVDFLKIVEGGILENMRIGPGPPHLKRTTVLFREFRVCSGKLGALVE